MHAELYTYNGDIVQKWLVTRYRTSIPIPTEPGNDNYFIIIMIKMASAWFPPNDRMTINHILSFDYSTHSDGSLWNTFLGFTRAASGKLPAILMCHTYGCIYNYIYIYITYDFYLPTIIYMYAISVYINHYTCMYNHNVHT
jgi:hypothetical protein